MVLLFVDFIDYLMYGSIVSKQIICYCMVAVFHNWHLLQCSFWDTVLMVELNWLVTTERREKVSARADISFHCWRENKHKFFLRAIPECTDVTVNIILNVYRGNPNYYYSVLFGTSVTSAKDYLLEREIPPVFFLVTEGCNFLVSKKRVMGKLVNKPSCARWVCTLFSSPVCSVYLHSLLFI